MRPDGASGLRLSRPLGRHPNWRFLEGSVFKPSHIAAPLVIATALIATPARADHPKAFGPTFGLASPIYALGNVIDVTYYGWEETTVYGHTLWAFTAAQYEANLGANCFSWESCVSVTGQNIATKPYGGGESPNLPGGTPGPLSSQFAWEIGTEIIFAIMVDQQDGYNWFFSGAPARNGDGLAHLAFFDPILYPNGVPGNQGIGVVPQTSGLYLFGFEDVHYEHSDWDFDNLLFAINQDSVNPPTETVPEPATMLLVATGLSGIGALRRRRARMASPES
jgi:hypothetical protein